MTFDRFKEIWNEIAPDLRFERSPRLQEALIAAAEGDFSAFEAADKIRAERHAD